MRVRVHQMLVALPLTLVSALGIAVGVQSFSLESADLLSMAPADSALPLDAVRGSVEGVVPPPPVRPAEPAQALAAPASPATPADRAITGFTAPAGGTPAVAAAPAPKVKAPAVKTQRPKSAAPPRTAPRNLDCVPVDPTLRSLPNPHGVARAVPRERAASGPAAGSPLLPGSIPARNSAGLPGRGSPATGLINGPSTSRPGPSISSPGPSISKPSTSRTRPEQPDSAQIPTQDPFADAEQVGLANADRPADGDPAGFSGTTRGAGGDAAGFSGTTPRADADQVGSSEGTPRADADQGGTAGQAPQTASCNGPGHSGRRRVPASEPVISRDGGLATPARSGW